MTKKVAVILIKVLGFLASMLLNAAGFIFGAAIGGFLYIALAHATGGLHVADPCYRDYQTYNYKTGELCPTENTQ